MKQNKLTTATALNEKPKKTAFQVYATMSKVTAEHLIPSIDTSDDEEYYSSELQQERKEIGKELKSLRLGKGMTQGNIAKGIGSSVTTICNFEKGRYLTRWDMIEKTYRMYLETQGSKGEEMDVQKTLPTYDYVQAMRDIDQVIELETAQKKCHAMTQFIQSHNLVEQYNLTVMTDRRQFQELSIPIGQHELDTMKELVKQYDEVKYRLTALYEMGDDETGGELQELYDQTGLEY